VCSNVLILKAVARPPPDRRQVAAAWRFSFAEGGG
jgi:hypothetical protein